MKDIYELLSEANIDVTEIDTNNIEEMEVSEVERRRGRKKLIKSIKVNGKITMKKIAMVVSLALLIGATSIVVTKPAWAVNLPVIGDLIQKNLINVNSKYQDYIQAVGQTKRDKGIDITFESAIADSNILNLSFIVKNNNKPIKDDYTDAMLIPTSLKVNGKDVSTGAGGTHEIIDENTIRVLKNINWDYGKLPNKLNIDIGIGEMFGKKGNWDVNFALDATEINKDTYVEKLDKVINANGIDVNIEKLVMTPLTTKLEYSSKEFKYLMFIIIDGDGKEVRSEGDEVSNNWMSTRYEGSSNYTNNLNTKTLKIIPWYPKSDQFISNSNEEKLPPRKINIDSFSPINLKINEDTSIDINECIVDGEFLIIKYNYRYLNTVMVRGLFSNLYTNVDGEDISNDKNYNDGDREKQIELYNKYSNSNTNINIVKIGSSKDIEIGCYDGTSKVYLKDEAFTVTKK
ncbi:MAG: DUF4179 domain-containing protein [Clostridium sp.]